MFSCVSLDTEAVVDVAVLLCEYLFQTNTPPLPVHEFTSLTYKNRKLLVLSNICWATIISLYPATTGAVRLFSQVS